MSIYLALQILQAVITTLRFRGINIGEASFDLLATILKGVNLAIMNGSVHPKVTPGFMAMLMENKVFMMVLSTSVAVLVRFMVVLISFVSVLLQMVRGKLRGR